MNCFNLKWMLLSSFLLIASGCGDGKIGVSGSITYEGVSPEVGTIAFIGENGAGTTYGGPYKNGEYSTRVPEGEYLVRITGWKVVPLDKPIESNMGRPTITTRDEVIVPEEYGNRSKMKIEIKRPMKTYDFSLEKPIVDVKP